MKIRSILILAVIAIASPAATNGQFIAQPMGQMAPGYSAQPWANPTVGPYNQLGMTQNTAYANAPVYNPNMGGAVDAGNGSCNCGSSQCGGCGIGGHCGAYDPCCPTKYFSIYGGASSFQDIDYAIDLNSGGGALTLDALLETETGWNAGAAVGRSFGRRFRGEFGFTYRTAAVENGELLINNQSIGTIELDGDLNMYAFMPCLLFDFCPKSRFNPYIGVGTGYVFQELEVTEPTIPITVELEDSSFAYQGIVGISSCLNPRTEMFVEYRFFETAEFSLDVGTPIGSASFTTDTTSHDIMFGLRIKRQ